MHNFSSEQFGRVRYVSVVLRLVIDSKGALIRGELVDAESQAREGFRGSDGLFKVLESYLRRLVVTDGQDQIPGA